MNKSFFVKYGDYETGIRLVMHGDHEFSILHNKNPEPEDERFEYGLESIFDLRDRLVELFPSTDPCGKIAGEVWFFHLILHMFRLAERVKARNKKCRSDEK